MNRAAALLLAVLLLVGGTATGASRDPADGVDHALQAEMDRLFALRTVDPPAFIAGVDALEAAPAPTRAEQRQFLQLLSANRAALQGRFAEAIALAEPLAASADHRALRLAAGSFVVNMRAGTREFEAGLRDLDRLLRSNPKAEGDLRDAVHSLWAVAAIFYAELDQPALSAWYAQRLASDSPSPRQACTADHFIVRARQASKDPTLSADDFDRANQRCRETGENGVLPGLLSLAQARFLRDSGRLDDALALMAHYREVIDATRYPRLVAEAYALDAELLLAAGRVAQAERQAQRAIDTSRDAPTSLPVAIAEKVLFEIQRRRGDNRAALQHLQRYIAANRAVADEDAAKARAMRTVQHENLLRDQQLALATERNRVLDLEARLAKAESRNAIALAIVLMLTVIVLVAWGRRAWTDAKRLRDLAQTDPLTGFANRQHFSELAAAALARGRAGGRPLVLVAFDLDHFKRINDRHGHRAGDAVLRAVSDAVRAVPPPVPCILGRIGGEEFAVLLDGATADHAAAYADALRGAITSTRTPLEGGVAVAVTASFGLASTREGGHDLQALLDRSDRALYRAKNAGRDRVAAMERDGAIDAA
jgi:diguanylate cyclase (GGDEF)-like protein